MKTYRIGGARVSFTDRNGGVSTGHFASANLGPATGDDPAALAENRARVGQAIGGTTSDWTRWLWPNAMHGAEIVVVSVAPNDCDGTQIDPDTIRSLEADGMVTDIPGQPLVIHIADCAGVTLVSAAGIAAVHAGWKGLSSGVIEGAARALRDLQGAQSCGQAGPAPLKAIVSPCIGPCCYEFGMADSARLADVFGEGILSTSLAGRPSVDLRQMVRIALERAGVADPIMEPALTCTSCSSEHFSYRRDGVTGRQAMIASIVT